MRKAFLEREGGYLLPYKGQFFITEGEGIQELGLDSNDPDWGLIDWDWVKPKDNNAWKRLNQKRQTR